MMMLWTVIMVMAVVTLRAASPAAADPARPAATKGGVCQTVGSTTDHDRFCDLYYQCFQTLDAQGTYKKTWATRNCAPGTIWGPNSNCISDTAYTCAKASTAASSGSELNCTNGGTKMAGMPDCVCPAGYAGNQCEHNCTYEAECQDCISSPACICAAAKFGSYPTIFTPYKGVCNALLQCSRTGTPGNFVIKYTDTMCKSATIWSQDKLSCVRPSSSNVASCQTCASNPCKNGGNCTDLKRTTGGNQLAVGFKCNCPNNFTGVKCQAAAPPCSRYCANGGTCVQTGLTSYCECPTGYAGNRCERNCTYESMSQHSMISPECLCLGVDFDSANNRHEYEGVCNAYIECKREGTKGSYIISYKEKACRTDAIWTLDVQDCSHYIQTKLNKCKDCSSQPCMNGGTCMSHDQMLLNTTVSVGFTCNCRQGFTGMRCQTNHCTGPRLVADPVTCGKYWEVSCEGVRKEKSCSLPGVLVFDEDRGACTWKFLVPSAENCTKPVPSCHRNHPCLQPGVRACAQYEATPAISGSCPYSFYAQTSGVSTTVAGRAVFATGSYLKSYAMDGVGVLGKLTLEISFDLDLGGDGVQALIADGACGEETTFSLMLRRVSVLGYKLTAYVMDENGTPHTMHSQTILKTNTRYDVVFAYNAYMKNMTLVINGDVLTQHQIYPGKVKNGKSPFFIGRMEEGCDSSMVKYHFKGSIFRYRVLAGDVIEHVPATQPSATP